MIVGELGGLGYTETEIGRMSLSFARAVLDAVHERRREELEFLAGCLGARPG